MKHFLPLLPRQQRAVFATLSAKAALNQFVRTAAIELARSHPQALCVALLPGTVDTGSSQPFARSGLAVPSPGQAAAQMLDVIGQLTPGRSRRLIDLSGEQLPW